MHIKYNENSYFDALGFYLTVIKRLYPIYINVINAGVDVLCASATKLVYSKLVGVLFCFI